jgi:hypothetical protein
MGDTGTILIGTGTGRTAELPEVPGGGGGNQGTLVIAAARPASRSKEDTKQG